MNNIGLSIVLTSSCNLKCTYCINDSGNNLKINNHSNTEWNNPEEIIQILSKISMLRKINFIKFFGGEPLLKKNLIYEIIKARTRYDKTSETIFALTTNAYLPFDDDFLKFVKDNNIILNVSLDGFKSINNKARIAKDGGDVFENVILNISKLNKIGIKFAIIGVIDERIIEQNSSIHEIADFLGKLTPVYKLEPAYNIDNKKFFHPNVVNSLLQQLKIFVNSIFDSIRSLDENDYIFENNITRTIANIVFEKYNNKKYVCSAGNMLALFPNRRIYNCYNLINDSHLVSKNIFDESIKSLELKIKSSQKNLLISNFPDFFNKIKSYGDYCPLESNESSFAYLYRKNVIEIVNSRLEKIIPGSSEHLSLMHYLNKYFSMEYLEKSNLKI